MESSSSSTRKDKKEKKEKKEKKKIRHIEEEEEEEDNDEGNIGLIGDESSSYALAGVGADSNDDDDNNNNDSNGGDGGESVSNYSEDDGSAVANKKRDKLSKKRDRLKKEAIRYQEALKKRGIIYISRIPPHMKPNKVKSLMEDFGEVTRVFLQEESAETRHKRKLGGGNASKQFADGWVEFADKKLARNVAESLNNTSISRKKGDFYHDDLWSLKYLKNFKWDYLTEKIAYERRIRESKINLAMSKAKKVNSDFVEKIERTAALNRIKDRAEKRSRTNGDGGDSSTSGGGGADDAALERMKKKFKQTNVLASQHGENRAALFDSNFMKKVASSSKKSSKL